MSVETIELSPCQSLALRGAIEALKADDSLFEACPKVVRSALCDFLMPPFSSAELEILALKSDLENNFRLLEKFAAKIKTLEGGSR